MSTLRLLAVTALVGASPLLIPTSSLQADDTTNTPSPTATSVDPETAETVRALREKIEELDQKLKILERNEELQTEDLTKKSKETPKITLNEKGFNFESADKNYKIRIGALLQVDGNFFLDSNNNEGVGTVNPITGAQPLGPAESDTFLLRRVRPTLAGTLYDRLDFRITPELGGNNNGTPGFYLLDAYGDYRFTENNDVRLRFGSFKTPIGLERLQSASDLSFNERGFASGDFTTARDLGFQIYGTPFDGLIEWKAGVFNGKLDGYNGAVTGDLNDAFEAEGSIAITPFKSSDIVALQALTFGVGGTWGQDETVLNGTTFGQNALRYRSIGQQTTIFQIANVNPNAPIPVAGAISNAKLSGDKYKFNPNVSYYYRGFSLLGEAILSTYNVTASQANGLGGSTSISPQSLQNWGWTLQTGYVLTGEDASFKGIKPNSPVNLKAGGGWGAWEVVARWTGAEFDDDAFTSGLAQNGSVEGAQGYGVGVNWYLTANLKAALSWEQTFYYGGYAGTSTIGNEDVVFTRLQVNF
jgi:phosphate-selective porin OprO/OprP